MNDVRDLEPVVAPLATVPKPSISSERSPESGSAAQRRVQRAKARLSQHIYALDLRARTLVRQSAWFAGMVLLGLAGGAVAAAMLGSKAKRGMYHYRSQRRPGVGTALMLAALGLISQRARRLEPRLGRAYEP